MALHRKSNWKPKESMAVFQEWALFFCIEHLEKRKGCHARLHFFGCEACFPFRFCIENREKRSGTMSIFHLFFDDWSYFLLYFSIENIEKRRGTMPEFQGCVLLFSLFFFTESWESIRNQWKSSQNAFIMHSNSFENQLKMY